MYFHLCIWNGRLRSFLISVADNHMSACGNRYRGDTCFNVITSELQYSIGTFMSIISLHTFFFLFEQVITSPVLRSLSFPKWPAGFFLAYSNESLPNSGYTQQATLQLEEEDQGQRHFPPYTTLWELSDSMFSLSPLCQVWWKGYIEKSVHDLTD